MIKNFFVRTETIKFKEKGLNNFINYLTNTEHRNHKTKCEKIQNYINNDFVKKTLLKVTEKEFINKTQKRGGSSFQSYRQSFCFSFPKNIKPNDEELKTITQNLLKDISKILNVSPNDLIKNCFCNIHFNENIHINIVISKIFKNNKEELITLDLTKKKILNRRKNSFDNNILKVLKLDKNDYLPTSKNSKIRKNIHQIEKEKNIELLNIEINDRLKTLENIKKDFILFERDSENKKKVYKEILNPIIRAVKILKNDLKVLESKTLLKNLSEEKRKELKNKTLNNYEELKNKIQKQEVVKQIKNYVDYSPSF